jgi:hypothetical protein
MSRVSTSVMTATSGPESAGDGSSMDPLSRELASRDPGWHDRLQKWIMDGQALAAVAGGDPLQLLQLLRSIEQLHRDLQDGPFRASLPSDRRGLHDLLQSMERSGGWPYIPRLQLKTFMELLDEPTPPEL